MLGSVDHVMGLFGTAATDAKYKQKRKNVSPTGSRKDCIDIRVFHRWRKREESSGGV
jgi:hypothetical protein